MYSGPLSSQSLTMDLRGETGREVGRECATLIPFSSFSVWCIVPEKGSAGTEAMNSMPHAS